MGTDAVLSRVRQPEYTGENRCTPCTVVNVGIAVFASAALGLAVPALAPAAPVALGVFLAVIYLRGYLVPGTPALTERYVPDRVLRRFDKAPDRADATLVGAADDEIDPEPILLDGGVLEPAPDGADLRLTDGFRSAWHARIEAVGRGDYAPRLAELLSGDERVDPETLEVDVDDPTPTAFRDGVPVATWISKPALVADLAATPLLRERFERWDEVDLDVRGRLLHSTRLFLERCPTCDGELVLSEEAVESCCRTVEVVTLACEECDARVLEVEI